VVHCDDCGSTHMGGRCGTTFAGRLRSVQIDPRAIPTRVTSRGNYFDQEALNEGGFQDAKEQMLENTKGLGPAKRDTQGAWWRRDRKTGDAVRVTEKEADQVYLGGDSAEGL
jgi:hypothetical protein